MLAKWTPKDCYLSRKDFGLQGGDIQVVKPCKFNAIQFKIICIANGEDQPATSQMCEMDTPLDHA